MTRTLPLGVRRGTAVSLRLDDVLAYESRQHPRSQAGKTPRREPFALYFLGPRARFCRRRLHLARRRGDVRPAVHRPGRPEGGGNGVQERSSRMDRRSTPGQRRGPKAPFNADERSNVRTEKNASLGVLRFWALGVGSWELGVGGQALRFIARPHFVGMPPSQRNVDLVLAASAQRLHSLPLLARDARLSQDQRQQWDPNLSTIWVGMVSPTMRIPTLDGPPGRHQLARRTLTVAPASVGTWRPRPTRTSTHSSTTSANSRRQASRVFPVATTPRNPVRVPANVPSSMRLPAAAGLLTAVTHELGHRVGLPTPMRRRRATT